MCDCVCYNVVSMIYKFDWECMHMNTYTISGHFNKR